MNKAVIFDKDGVINYPVKREERETAPWTYQEFLDHLHPKAKAAIQLVKKHGYLALVATNQPGVMDGDMLMSDLDFICTFLEKEMGCDGVAYAMFRHDKQLYKPGPGMLLNYIHEFQLDTNDTWFIGDRMVDIIAGRRAGVHTIYVSEDFSKSDYDINHKFPEDCDNKQVIWLKHDILDACKFIVADD